MAVPKAILIRLAVALAVVVAVSWIIILMIRQEAVVVTATRDRAINAVPGSVTVLAERSLEVRAEVGGRVIKNHMEISAKVEEGGLLAEIDPTDLNLEIEQLLTDYDAAKKRVEIGSATTFELINAKEQLENAERIFKGGGMTAADLERARRAVQQIEQKIELEEVANQQTLSRLETELKVKERRREKMKVSSPVEGVISSVRTVLGDLIGDNTPIATIIADSRIIETKISEENFSGVRLGQKATVRFLGYNDKQYSAQVEKILPSADPLTQRYIVHLSVDVDTRLLVPGITGEANIVIDARDDAVIVPTRSVFGKNVFVVKDGRVELRTVVLGFTSMSVVEVLEGVQEGELVITENLDLFRDGDRVSVTETKS
ncbi:MAG TPA: efflux RND transporter periplasmic adaptor subunit [Opitutaceae bacterium]|nr:efflux RND transporter periplasmic adaptor subunit [Opitutaceae bacterium]